jgi:hypothetical protein
MGAISQLEVARLNARQVQLFADLPPGGRQPTTFLSKVRVLVPPPPKQPEQLSLALQYWEELTAIANREARNAPDTDETPVNWTSADYTQLHITLLEENLHRLEKTTDQDEYHSILSWILQPKTCKRWDVRSGRTVTQHLWKKPFSFILSCYCLGLTAEATEALRDGIIEWTRVSPEPTSRRKDPNEYRREKREREKRDGNAPVRARKARAAVRAPA